MPDAHRTALVGFRSRQEFDRSRFLTDEEQIKERWMEAEMYIDNLTVRFSSLAGHTLHYRVPFIDIPTHYSIKRII